MNAKPDIDEAAGIITEAGMRQIHAELAHWATYFLAIAEAMKLKKIPQLTDQNAITLMKAIRCVRNAAKQARFAFDAAQIPGGGVAVPPDPSQPPRVD